MTRELHRLMGLFTALFLVTALSTTYWAVLERDNLYAREDNPRRVLDELNIQRGFIFDRNGVILAETQPAETRAQGAIRHYPYPEAVSAVGHYSYQFGTAGIEATYNDLLIGINERDLPTFLGDEVLNRNPIGGDVQTTLDINLQLALHGAMKDQRGAGLLVHVPSGAVLAMVSLPAYNPNELDRFGAILHDEQPANIRILNRVTAGRYQAGGVLQTLWMSALLAGGMTSSTEVSLESFTLPELDLEIRCAWQHREAVAGLGAAYRLGCPTPFLLSAETLLTPATIADSFHAAQLWEPPHLIGFDLDLPDQTPPDFETLSLTRLQAEVAGQGALTVTPLHVVQLIAAVVNQGQGVNLGVVDSVRYPPDSTWEPLPKTTLPPALMQPVIASELEMILREQPLSVNPPIYGQVSHAYAGQREYSWFMGWTPLTDGSDVVMVLVLEGQSGEILPAQTVARARQVLSAITE